MKAKSFFTKVFPIPLWVFFAVLVAGCYDDTELRARLDEHEARLQALEKLCSEMNTNIASMQQIMAALQNNDFVTDVAPISENGKEIGYTITFSKSGAVTIYHGKDGKDGQNGKDGQDGKDGVDGKDGATPVVGLQQDTDGIWYWTLNGEWLLDEQGARVKAVGVDGQNGKDGKDGKDGKNGVDGQNGKDGKDGKDGVDGQNGQDGKDGKDGIDGQNGKDGKDGKDGQDGKDGKDGITPQLTIRSGSWYISYDEGQNWNYVGQATGSSGRDGSSGTNGKDGTSFFKSVTYTDYAVVLTLADGQTVITLPRDLELKVQYTPDNDTLTVPKTSRMLEIQYAIQASILSANQLSVEVIGSPDVTARVASMTVSTSSTSCAAEGKIEVTTGSSVSAFTKVTVFVSDDRKVLMRSFYFKMED